MQLFTTRKMLNQSKSHTRGLSDRRPTLVQAMYRHIAVI